MSYIVVVEKVLKPKYRYNKNIVQTKLQIYNEIYFYATIIQINGKMNLICCDKRKIKMMKISHPIMILQIYVINT